MKRSTAFVTAFLLWALCALLLSPPASAAVVTGCSTGASHIDWDWLHPAVRFVGADSANSSFCLRDTSKSGHRLVYQSDNNLVMYGNSTFGGCVLWASNTDGNYKSRLDFQTDGNVVLYDVPAHNVRWSSRTYQIKSQSYYTATVIGFSSSNPPYGVNENWTVKRTSPTPTTLATFGQYGCR